MMLSNDDKQKILVEIFELTGQKVGPDDPLVAAALFYTECLRRVSREHHAAVEALALKVAEDFAKSIDRSVASLATAADTERLAASNNYASIIKKAQHATYVEVPGIKRDFEKFAERLMGELRKKATPPAEIGLSLRTLLGVILVSAAGGVVAGFLWVCQFGLIDGRRLPAFADDLRTQAQIEMKVSAKHAKER